MIDIPASLAVESYCYRGFTDNAKTAELVNQCGLSRIEICGVHVDFADESAFDGVIQTYNDAGIHIVGLAVCEFSNDEARERKYFEFARRCGARYLAADFVIDTVPAAFDTAQKLADEYDINVSIHNHGGWHWLGNSQTLANVFANTSSRIGLCLDTAWAMCAQEDPIAMVERFADRLHAVHVKDFIFDRTGKQQDVVVGTGNLDLRKLYETFEKIGFTGQAVLEYEGDVDDPVPALKQCVEAIQAKMRA